MSVRLTAEFWVAAYRARLEAAGTPVYVTARGDPTAGDVLVKLAPLDGTARLYGRMADLDGTRSWAVVAEGPEVEVDATAARRRAVDPDLWLIEVEARDGDARLDEAGL